MTKKDYVLLAQAIARCRPADPVQLAAHDAIVASIARALKFDNCAFDPTKFILECSKP